jgi:thiamine transport system permease protein
MLKNFGNPYLLAIPVTAIVNALISLPFVIRILKPPCRRNKNRV